MGIKTGRWEYEQTNEYACLQKGIYTNKRAYEQTDWRTDRQIDRLIDIHTDRQEYGQADGRAYRRMGIETDRWT